VVAAHCVKFSSDGNKIYCGFNKMIRVFDVTRPGRDFESRPTFGRRFFIIIHFGIKLLAFLSI
jgi:hypothetical protein